MGFWSGALKGATTGAIIGAAILGGLAILSGNFLLAIPVAVGGALQFGLIGGIVSGVIGAFSPDPNQPAPNVQEPSTPAAKTLEKSPTVSAPSQEAPVGVSSSFVQNEQARRQAAAQGRTATPSSMVR